MTEQERTTIGVSRETRDLVAEFIYKHWDEINEWRNAEQKSPISANVAIRFMLDRLEKGE